MSFQFNIKSPIVLLFQFILGLSLLTGLVIDSISVNEKVYLDLEQGVVSLERLVIGSDGSGVSKTSENYRALCPGKEGYGYQSSSLVQVTPRFVIRASDFTNEDSTGERPLYGPTFDDKNLSIDHAPYRLFIYSTGPDSNGSQIFLCLMAIILFNGKNAVFVEVLSNFGIFK